VRDFDRKSLYSAYATRVCTRCTRARVLEIQSCWSAAESADMRLYRDAKDARKSGVDLQSWSRMVFHFAISKTATHGAALNYSHERENERENERGASSERRLAIFRWLLSPRLSCIYVISRTRDILLRRSFVRGISHEMKDSRRGKHKLSEKKKVCGRYFVIIFDLTFFSLWRASKHHRLYLRTLYSIEAKINNRVILAFCIWYQSLFNSLPVKV